MITLLARLFIRGNKNYTDNNVRESYGILCGAVGIFFNALLFVLKFAAGTLITKSVSVVADAFNNLSDAASSIVQIFGFKLSAKKPDSEHPFGHGRIEYIAGLVISFLILMTGIELLKQSVEKLLSFSSGTQNEDSSSLSIAIMTISLAVKFYMCFYNRSVARKIHSVSLEAAARDSLSDTVSSLVVIASLLISRFSSFPADGAGGIIVAFFILSAGLDSAKQTISPLLGTPPSIDFIKAIEAETLLHEPIRATHDIVVHDYGPGRKMVSLHAEVPGDRDIFELHDAINEAELAIAEKFGCPAVIHMDPTDTSDPRLPQLQKLVSDAAESLSTEKARLLVHDIRLVRSRGQTKLMFDVVKPFACKMNAEDIKSQMCRLLKQKQIDLPCVITIDSPFV